MEMILGIYELGCLIVALFYCIVFSDKNNRDNFNEAFGHESNFDITIVFTILMLGSWITIIYYLKYLYDRK